MSLLDDLENEMEHVPLDADTADRILAGATAPEDAPPTYAGVVRLLENVPETGVAELPREAAMVSAIAAAVRASANPPVLDRRKSRMTSTLVRPKLAAAFLAASLAATTSLAFAGSLPGAAQDVASAVLATLGVQVPGPNSNAGDHPNVVPAASEGSVVCAAQTGGICTQAQTSPEALAAEARATRGTGICVRASDGACEARSGNGNGNGGNGGGTNAPATPNAGGTATADTASGGASSGGTATANTASGGASAAGSGNADSAPASGGSTTSSGGSATADSASSGASSEGTSTAGAASGGASSGVSTVPPVDEISSRP